MNALSLHRFAHWCDRHRIPILPRVIYQFTLLVFHSSIPASTRIGKGTQLGYGGMGIVIHERVVIGQRVMIAPQVTIGGRGGHHEVPIIEDDVYLAPGARVLGPVRVGKGAVVGANAVVIRDVPAGAVVGGVPARILRSASLVSLAFFIACSDGGAAMQVDERPAPMQVDSAVLNTACAVNAAPPVTPPTRTFYINAQTGNDRASGRAREKAWKTLAKANAIAEPGDHFILAGMFRKEYIRPQKSGTAARKIVYRARPGSMAVLDGGNFGTLVWLDERSHVVVEGLELMNEEYPILLRSGAHDIWLRQLFLHDIGSIQILRSSNNRLEDSKIQRCGKAKSNEGDCIWIADGSNRNVVTRNFAEYGGHGIIAVGGDKLNMAPSYDNVILHNDFTNPWAGNTFILGHGKRTTLECNRIRDASKSAINYARAGVQINASDNIVRHNEIYGNAADGIQLQGYTFQGLVQNATGNRIAHNTIWGNGGAGLMMLQKDIGQVKDNVIENNIFWGNHASREVETSRFYEGSFYEVWVDLYHANVPWGTNSLNGNVIRSNVLGKGTGPFDRGWLLVVQRPANKSYSLLDAHAYLSGVKANTDRDPMLRNPAAADFRLQPASRVPDKGARVRSN